VCDAVASVITLGKWLIAGAAGLALVVIVFGAIGMITAAGNAEKIGGAKKQIIGAIFGLGITLVAFQLISLIIFAVAVPSGLQTSTADKTVVKDNYSLKNFLGVAWWSICDEKELRTEKGIAADPSTGHCKYWGDGTPCNTRTTKICISGECSEIDLEKNPLKEHLTNLGLMNDAKKHKAKMNKFDSACDYLASVDLTFEDYGCRKHDPKNDKSDCDPRNIEQGLCPGDETNVCCAPAPTN
jgi:uncharacterized membrane protein